MANLRNVIRWEWLVFKTLLYLTLEVLLFHLNMKKRLAIWLRDEPIFCHDVTKMSLDSSRVHYVDTLRSGFTNQSGLSIWWKIITHTHTLLSKFTHQPFELLLALQEVNNVKLKHHNKRKVDKPRTVCDPSLRSCVRHKNVSWSPSLKKYTSIGG